FPLQACALDGPPRKVASLRDCHSTQLCTRSVSRKILPRSTPTIAGAPRHGHIAINASPSVLAVMHFTGGPRTRHDNMLCPYAPISGRSFAPRASISIDCFSGFSDTKGKHAVRLVLALQTVAGLSQ